MITDVPSDKPEALPNSEVSYKSLKLWNYDQLFGSECISLYSHYFGISNVSRIYKTNSNQKLLYSNQLC